jgi:hypothetical protein
MSAPFVTQLRANQPPITIGPGPGAITFRVEASDVWDAVRVVASPESRVAEVKQKVVATLLPNHYDSEFVLKLRGWEILDESATLASAGKARSC